MRAGLFLCLFLALQGGFAWAEAPATSPRPETRPELHPEAATSPEQQPVPHPKPRPSALASVQTQTPTAKPAASLKGSVCNNPNIKGQTIDPIRSRIKGCNVKAPVLVTMVNGVRLSPAATINCDEAAALASWITQGVQPVFDNQVVQLNVADSYSCRPRNNVRGAKISEHGAGNAIDISGFVLNSGKTLTVESNYRGAIKKAHKAACGIFHTTLGPGSDGYHENHLHLDVAHYRGRPYCH